MSCVDPSSGALVEPVKNFDTWADKTQFTSLVAYLSSLPDGFLVLLATCDEAGLNAPYESIAHKPEAEPVFALLRIWGSEQIAEYGYWDSWAMVVIKGQGYPVAEQLSKMRPAEILIDLPLPLIHQIAMSPSKPSRNFRRSSIYDSPSCTS